MSDVQAKIAREIRLRNTYDAKLKSLQRNRVMSEVTSDEMNTLKARVDAVDIWLSFIPATQAFVVKKHLVDGLDWTQVTQEFNEKWGEECRRHARTLERYQKKALNTIEAFVLLFYDSYSDMLGE